MMKFVMMSIAALGLSASPLAGSPQASAAQAGPQAAAGLIEFEIPGARTLDAHVMYPAAGTDETLAFAGNPVWQAVEVAPNAEPVSGRMPLIVLSHGMFGNRFNQAWLGSALARAGHIVVAVNHPGNSTWNRDPKTSGQIWNRAADLTQMIDHMLADPNWAARIDRDAIFAIGHSLGGFGVLNAAGARFDAALSRKICGDTSRVAACDAFDVLNVDISDAQALEADMSDPRLAGVVSLDPGGTFGFSEGSLSAIETPVLLISAMRTPMQVDPRGESDRVASLIAPSAVTYLPMEDAGHFDFMGVCTPNGLAILAEEEPDDLYVCENGTQARETIHALTLDAILEFIAVQK